MADSHPLEQLLREAYPHVDLLFRAPAGVLACVCDDGDDVWRLVRLALPSDGEDIDSRLDAWLAKQAPISHPGLLWPEKTLCDGGLPAVAYQASGVCYTLSELALFGAKGWPLSRLVGQLVPVVEGIAALHDAGMVHGAIAPVTVLVDELDGVPFLRLFDIGLWEAVRPLKVRNVLGAGPAAKRKNPPTFASDVRALGHILLWLMAIADSAGYAEEAVPEELLTLAGQCTRRQPISAEVAAKDLQRILAEWGTLPITSDEPQPTTLDTESGAFKGVLVRRTLPLTPLPRTTASPQADAAADAADDGWHASDVDELDDEDSPAHDEVDVSDVAQIVGDEEQPPAPPGRAPQPHEDDEDDEDDEDAGPPGADGDVGTPSSRQQPAPDTQDEAEDDDGYDPFTSDLGYDPEKVDPSVFIPKEAVIMVEVVLKPDVIYRSETYSEKRALLILCCVLVGVVLLIVFLFWSILRQDAAPEMRAAPASGVSRVVVPFGDGGQVQALATGPLGFVFATCNDDIGQIFSNTDPVRLESQFFPGDDGCRHLAFAPDGQSLAFVGHSGQVYRYDVLTDAAVEPFGERSGASVLDLRVGDDGVVLLTQEPETGSRAWRVVSAEGPPRLIALPDGAMPCTSRSPRVAAYALGTRVVGVALATGRVVTTVDTSLPVRSCAWSPDDLRVAADVLGQGIRIYEASSGDDLVDATQGIDLPRTRGPAQLAFAGGGHRLLVRALEEAWLVSLPFGRTEARADMTRTASGRTFSLQPLGSSGRVVALADVGVQVIDLFSGEALLDALPGELPYRHLVSAFAPSGTQAVSAFSLPRTWLARLSEPENVLVHWDFGAPRRTWTLPVERPIVALSYAPRGDTIAMIVRAQGDYRLQLTHVESHLISGGVPLASVPRRWEWTEDSEALLVQLADRSALLVKGRHVPVVLRTFPADSAVAMYRDGILLRWGSDGLVVGNVRDDEESPTIVPAAPVHDAADVILALHTHRSTRDVIARGRHQNWRINLETRTVQALSPAGDVVFSPDGTRVLSAGRIVATESAPLQAAVAAVVHIQETEGRFDELRWSGDQQFIVATGTDTAIWDAGSGKLLRRLARASDTDPLAPRRAPLATHPDGSGVLRDRAGLLTLSDLRDGPRAGARLVRLGLANALDGWVMASSDAVIAAVGSSAARTDGFTSYDALGDDVSTGLDAVLASLAPATATRPDALAGWSLRVPRRVRRWLESTPSGATARRRTPTGAWAVLGTTPCELELSSDDAPFEVELHHPGYVDRVVTMTPGDGEDEAHVKVLLLDPRTDREAPSLAIKGPLDGDEFLGLVQLERDRLDRCVERHSLFGGVFPFGPFGAPSGTTMDLHLAISPAGDLWKVETESSLPTPEEAACVEGVVGDWRFPTYPTGSLVDYRLIWGPP